jgi:hypothetical protein
VGGVQSFAGDGFEKRDRLALQGPHDPRRPLAFVFLDRDHEQPVDVGSDIRESTQRGGAGDQPAAGKQR